MIKISLNKNKEAGFIALVSTIIIASILLIITVALNMTGFLGRSNILDSELKQVSLHLAEACGDTALVKLADDPSYDPTDSDPDGEVVTVGSDTCTIKSLESDTPSAGQTTIKTTATPSNSSVTTNIEIVIDSVNLSIISWQEVSEF